VIPLVVRTLQNNHKSSNNEDYHWKQPFDINLKQEHQSYPHNKSFQNHRVIKLRGQFVLFERIGEFPEETRFENDEHEISAESQNEP
jgi:hypothetical protein